MPRQGNYTQEQVNTRLQDYVFPEECAAGTFPRAFAPEMVSAFIADRVSAEKPRSPARMVRVTRLVRFYTLRDRVGQLQGLIDGKEKAPKDLARSGLLIEAVGQLGDAGRQEAMIKEYERLVADRVAEQDDGLEVLIRTYFSLPPQASSASIKKRVADARAACEKNGPPEKLGVLMNDDIRLLPWVIAAKARKDWIATKLQGAEQMQRWASSYLLFDMDTPFKWDEYAGFALVAAARQQGDQAAVAAIKDAMQKVKPEEDEQELTQFRKTRGYRAREYFLDSLTEQEQSDYEKNERAQDDLFC